MLQPSLEAASIALLGTNSSANIASFLSSNGHTVANLGSSPPSSYAGYDTVILIRYTPGAGTASTNLVNFVAAGGTLITEWDSSAWALNTQGLLNATDTGGGFVGTGTPVTFTAAGLAAGWGTGLTNPYSDGPRTEFFRTFGTIGSGVDILATRPGSIPAILGGSYGAGTVFAIGYDWADGFPASSSGNGQMLLNAISAGGGSLGGIPEPSTWALLASGLGVIALRRKR